jgi:hypothetical protein
MKSYQNQQNQSNQLLYSFLISLSIQKFNFLFLVLIFAPDSQKIPICFDPSLIFLLHSKLTKTVRSMNELNFKRAEQEMVHLDLHVQNN